MTGPYDAGGLKTPLGPAWLCLAVLLAACGHDNLGVSGKVQAGAERAVTPSNSLPPARQGRQYEGTLAPDDETRTAPQIGAIVAKSGGQLAQKKEQQKEAAADDAKARDTRAKAEAEAAAQKPAALPPAEKDEGAATVAEPQTQAAAVVPEANVTSHLLADAEPAPSPTQPAPVAVPESQGSTTTVPVSPRPPESVVGTSTTRPLPDAEPESLVPASASFQFAANSAEIDHATSTELDRIAKLVNERALAQIELRAYASSSADAESRKVAMARALAVRSYLIDDGVRAHIKVETFAAGKDAGRSQRVDLAAPGL